jgi:hypothetical protein
VGYLTHPEAKQTEGPVEIKAVSLVVSEECQASSVRIDRCQKSLAFEVLGRTGKCPAKGLFQRIDGNIRTSMDKSTAE